MSESISQPFLASMTSISGACSARMASKSASGSPIFSFSSLYLASTSIRSRTPSSTFSLTVLDSSSCGSCIRMPTLKPGVSFASPLEGWSSPAIIFSTVDLPAPLGPTTPILAPG
jgi:hypothetical protein